MRVIRAVFAALVVMLAGGCFWIQGQGLQPTQREDVGELLSFTLLPTSQGPKSEEKVELRRMPGLIYEITITENSKSDTLPIDFAWATIRRVGERHGEPIFMINLEANYSINANEEDRSDLAGFIVLRSDGYGVSALFDCDDPKMQALAKKHHYWITCDRENPYLLVLRIGIEPSDGKEFMEEAMAANLVGWEDEAGVSIFEDFTNSIK